MTLRERIQELAKYLEDRTSTIPEMRTQWFAVELRRTLAADAPEATPVRCYCTQPSEALADCSCCGAKTGERCRHGVDPFAAALASAREEGRRARERELRALVKDWQTRATLSMREHEILFDCGEQILAVLSAPAPAAHDTGRPDEPCTNCGALRSTHLPGARGGLDCPPRADGKVPVVVGHSIVDMDTENHRAITRPRIEWRDPAIAWRDPIIVPATPGTLHDEGSAPAERFCSDPDCRRKLPPTWFNKLCAICSGWDQSTPEYQEAARATPAAEGRAKEGDGT